MMFAMIILAGIRMLSGAEQTRRSGLIIAVSLGCGLAVTVRPDLLSKMPAFVREVFGSKSLSPPRSKVRMVTGLPFMLLSTSR